MQACVDVPGSASLVRACLLNNSVMGLRPDRTHKRGPRHQRDKRSRPGRRLLESAHALFPRMPPTLHRPSLGRSNAVDAVEQEIDGARVRL
jgi:hypothetical protein